ncbi:MAG: hypothetical protein Q7J30_01810, partial [Candidatus Azambacteria bacterium]|nr:hypothetical protein [Candidatus Azambacteria bacterium]
SAAFDAIIRGEEIKKPSLPASFNVLVNELKSLGLSVELVERAPQIAAEEETPRKEVNKVRIRT